MWKLRWALTLGLTVVFGCAGTAPADFEIPGRMGLASLMSLSDGHLESVADDFQLLATRDEARSAHWPLIEAPLAAVAEKNVPGLYWFALTDGSYWSVTEGKAAGNLSDRPYWSRLMAGEVIVGDLVASKATGKASAIVAVPVRAANGAIVGALGSSVFIDQLSLRLTRELDLQPELIFFSIDATPIGALQEDPAQIFLDPFALDEPELEAAIRQMLESEEGVVTYRFRGKGRTVLYRKSKLTPWWYAFGRVTD
jgi:hypothetical protein